MGDANSNEAFDLLTVTQSAPRKNNGKGRLLLFSYAFPPMQTQMAPVAAKPMAALGRLGYEVDVLCAAPFSKYLGRDDSLLPYTKKNFRNIISLQPRNDLIGRLRERSIILSKMPDLMSILHREAFDVLMSMDLDNYEAVMTWSPFHSVNPVMAKLKRNRRGVRWVAQFSDPWAGNPLEKRIVKRIWSEWQEPRTVSAADYIVHSSGYSRELMTRRHSAQMHAKSCVTPHPFDDALFPQRPKARNELITLRYIGVLFGRRSPEPLFQALILLLEKRPALRDKLHIELVGGVPSEMLETSAARSLPKGLVAHVPNVSYMESLEKMYDADILILIEADVRQNLFVPSKLSDYMGARTPIVGIAPAGGSEDVLKQLGCWNARPSCIESIARALASAVDYVTDRPRDSWCDPEFRSRFSSGHVAESFERVLNDVRSQ